MWPRKSSHNPSVPVMYVKPAISKTQAGPATLYLPRLDLVGPKDIDLTPNCWTVKLEDFTDRPVKTPAVHKIQNNVHMIKESKEYKLPNIAISNPKICRENITKPNKA